MEVEWAVSNKTKERNMSTIYSIHQSSNGAELARITVDDTTEIENLSTDNTEGHFLAGQCGDVLAAGVDPFLSVYAIIH